MTHVATVDIYHDKFDFEDGPWMMRQRAIELGKTSQERWAELSPEHQDTLSKVLARAMHVMAENVEHFAPVTITGVSDDMITFEIMICMAPIEEAVEVLTT